MKQITAQQFANIFGVFVAKDKCDGLVFVYEHKPILYFGKSAWFVSSGICRRITELISDADSLDWNVLIEPQPVQFSCIPFDEKNAPIYTEGAFYMTSTGGIRAPKEIAEVFKEVPFDENYAPEGCKAVKWVRGQNCEPCCLYQDKCDQTPVMECVPSKRPDRTDVYFVKKEDEK